jgi:hypothetical protein
MKVFIKAAIVCALIVSAAIGPSLYAATLSVSPPSNQYEVGQTMAVAVLLASVDQSANAMSANLTFPADKLTVTSISKAGSIVQLWASEPKFSNSAGTVTMEGVIPNPGFTGAGGKLVTIYFRVKDTGKATISFSSNSSVLANDGTGTDILRNKTNGEYTLVPATEVPKPDPQTPAPVKPKPSTPAATTTPATTTEQVVTPVVSTSTPEKKFDFLNTQALLMVLIVLVLLALLIALYTWYQVRHMRKSHPKGLAALEMKTHKAFQLLAHDLEKHLKYLEGIKTEREWTKAEEEFVNTFKGALQDAEQYLSDEMRSLK